MLLRDSHGAQGIEDLDLDPSTRKGIQFQEDLTHGGVRHHSSQVHRSVHITNGGGATRLEDYGIGFTGLVLANGHQLDHVLLTRLESGQRIAVVQSDLFHGPGVGPQFLEANDVGNAGGCRIPGDGCVVLRDHDGVEFTGNEAGNLARRQLDAVILHFTGREFGTGFHLSAECEGDTHSGGPKGYAGHLEVGAHGHIGLLGKDQLLRFEKAILVEIDPGPDVLLIVRAGEAGRDSDGVGLSGIDGHAGVLNEDIPSII